MTITIDLAALRDWETGAPEPEPNRDGAFDADEPDLPGAWQMSIRELDSWERYYKDRLRLFGTALTPGEEAHRAEVQAQINSRHEARRHSAFPR